MIPNEYQIKDYIPTFTTPSLDFNHHSKELEELVDKLYKFKKIEKDAKIVEELREQTLKRFNLLVLDRNSRVKKVSLENKFDPTLSLKQKGKYHYLRGKILDLDEFSWSKEAEEDFARGLKYHPGLKEAWNCLGECFWKKGDYRGRYSNSSGARVIIETRAKRKEK
jgi:hypothetical protein